MPTRCCVPGCFSNSCKGPPEKVRVFTFPKDGERKAQWIKSIESVCQKSWIPGPNSVVCIYHFEDKDIIKSHRLIQKPDGIYVKGPRLRFRLKAFAVPSIFPDSPLYRRPRHITVTVDNDLSNDFLENDQIESFSSLYDVKKLNTLEISCGWKCQIEKTHLTFYKMYLGIIPIQVASSITINKDMHVDAFAGQVKVQENDLLFLSQINGELTIELWSQLENLMNFLDSVEDNEQNITCLQD